MAERGELTRVGPAVGFLERVGLLESELHHDDTQAGFDLLFSLAKEGVAQERLDWRTAQLHVHVLTALSEDRDPVRYLQTQDYVLDGADSAVLIDATAKWLEDTARIALETTMDAVPVVTDEQQIDAEADFSPVMDEALKAEVEQGPEDWVDTVMTEVADFLPQTTDNGEAPSSPRTSEETSHKPVTSRATERVEWPGGMRVPRVEQGNRFEKTRGERTKGKGDERERAAKVSRPIEPLGELVDIDDGDEGEWQERALCAQTDPEAFFPDRGGSTREAKRICQGCEVRSECLDYAISHDERFGIWGGLSERERRKLRKRAS